MSYAGTGTVQEKWQQAQNLINQQTAIIISELVESQRRLQDERRRRESVEKTLKEYKENPIAYTEGWYVKELGKARERTQKLESDLRRQAEFMKLKDQAKIKVEKVRDKALRDVQNLNNIVKVLRTKSIDVEALQTANEKQAIAWKQSQERNERLRAEIRSLREENERLLEVIKLGRDGLRSEQW